MPKRPFVETSPPPHGPKRRKQHIDKLSALSDELLLRIFTNLPVQALVICQQVSKKLHTIAGDAQLWKAAYYNQFVRPRAKKVRGSQGSSSATGRLHYSSRKSIWLGEEKLVRSGNSTNWKSQYKLANNWSKGNCDVSKISLAGQRSVPSLLARLQNGVVYTVDTMFGLRAWSYKKDQKLLAVIGPEQLNPGASQINMAPTSLALEMAEHLDTTQILVIGFQDGSYSCFEFRLNDNLFQPLYRHKGSSSGPLSHIAVAWPYLLTMTLNQQLSVYRFLEKSGDGNNHGKLSAPTLLHSYTSHSISSPLSLSVHRGDKGLIVSLVFSQPTFLSGWSTAVQEIWMTPEGKVLDTRLASTLKQRYRLGLNQIDDPVSDIKICKQGWHHPSPAKMIHECPIIYSKPLSLSYSHPYLLVSHADSTLSLHLVTSTTSNLSITCGKRLWGHTSSISGAHVAGRGKAVSVSVRGEEIRVWELEGSVSSDTSSFHRPLQNLSVQVTSDKSPRLNTAERMVNINGDTNADSIEFASAYEQEFDDQDVAQGWIEFDDENVVVLRENTRGNGSEALMIYDFS